MGKYWQVAKISWQNALIYQVNLVTTSVMDVLRIIAEICFWAVFYQTTHKTIAGYSLESIATYYVFVFVIGSLTNMYETGANIAQDIRAGRLSQFLARPINYLGYYLADNTAKVMLRTGITLLIFGLAFCWRGADLVLVSRPAQLAVLPLVLFLSYILSFLLNAFVSLLAFWVTEVGAFSFLKDILLDFLSGKVFPLSFLPRGIVAAFSLFPFMYVNYFPVRILTSAVSTSDLALGVLVQCTWIGFLYGASRLLWRYGVRVYTGTGI